MYRQGAQSQREGGGLLTRQQAARMMPHGVSWRLDQINVMVLRADGVPHVSRVAESKRVSRRPGWPGCRP